MSDKIKAHHLNRNAVLYVRQSSTFQVTHNEESRRLQYAMKNGFETWDGRRSVSLMRTWADQPPAMSSGWAFREWSPKYAWVKWEWSQRERYPALPATVRTGNS